MSAVLATAVTVHLPSGTKLFLAGETPSAQEAALITNPACWVEGVLPDLSKLKVELPNETPSKAWKKTEIEQWCQDNGIDLPSGLTKDDILEVISQAGDEDASAQHGDDPAAGEADGEGKEDESFSGDPVGDPE